MSNLEGKLSQNGTAVVYTQASTYYTALNSKLQTSIGQSLSVVNGYMSKFEIVDELRKILIPSEANKAPDNIKPLLDKEKPMTELASKKEDFDALEVYINELAKTEKGLFNPPLGDTFQAQSQPVYPIPQSSELDPRRFGRLFTFNPFTVDVRKWLINNALLYGFTLYENYGLYYIGFNEVKSQATTDIAIRNLINKFQQTPISTGDITLTAAQIKAAKDPAQQSVEALGITPRNYYENLATSKKTNVNLVIQEARRVGITNPYTIAGILSIASKESDFTPQSEILTYSRGRLPEVWAKFSRRGKLEAKGTGDQWYNSLAEKVANNAEALAEEQYGKDTKKGKDGGNIAVGDGFRYRGRGFNQITFKSTYKRYGELIGVDLVNFPDRLNEPLNAAKAFIQFCINGFKTLGTTASQAYNAQNINDFKNNIDAVLAFYHVTSSGGTGGMTKANQVKALVQSDSIGGMKKALANVDSLYRHTLTVPT